MISTTATPAKTAKVRCTECGLESRAPIVVEVGSRSENKVGRCADRKACAMRKRRSENKRKAETT